MTASVPAISVVIPAANEEAYIARALTSIISQQYPSIEIIVVVNGSDDRTAEVARSYTEKVYIYPNLLGYSAARNEGARKATGDVLIFMDADSYLEPDGLVTIIRFFKPNMFGTVLGAPDNEKIIYRIFFLIKNAAHILGLYKGVLGGVMYCDKNLFRTVGGYNQNMHADENLDFSRRARLCGGTYALIRACRAYTSMRRFEKYGIFPILSFWIRLRATQLFRLKSLIRSSYKLRQ